ncbi:hypothetical protein TIFTF001_010055 [Ficus carica]|uniref:Uncharacterized protein n=1 Tax=Ficus carica TaxID=3494 RepID=A0AA87ZVU4_FICCA|nr:hypothetical protein TIFTF001_010055 [Ficus carica]
MPYCDSFESTPEEDRDKIPNKLMCKRAYRDWKNNQHRWFKKHGGPVDLDTARARRSPRSITIPTHWSRYNYRFMSEDFHISNIKITSENQSKQKYTNHHETSSVAQHVHKKFNAETQQPKSLVDNWQELHQRRDEQGNLHWSKMIEERQNQQSQYVTRLFCALDGGIQKEWAQT